MRRRTAVGVDDDLAAGDAGVAVRTADDETAGRVDEVSGVLVDHRLGDDAVDDLFLDVGAELLVRNPALCCVEMTTVSTRTGRPLSYSIETCDLPSGRR